MKNKTLEDNGDWLLIDISTPNHSPASMAIDKVAWEEYHGGRVYASAGPTEKYIYAMKRENGKNSGIHHNILKPKEGYIIDHRVHGTFSFIDNRLSNLRYATCSQNSINKSRQINNTSGIIGVLWNKKCKKWYSTICVDGKNKHLGSYDNIDFAIGARQQAEREYFGEFAYNENN